MKRIIALLCVILFAFSLVACGSGDPETNYNKALEYLEKGEYEKAHRLLYELGDYKDAAEYLGKFKVRYQQVTLKGDNASFTFDFEYDDYGYLVVADRYDIANGGVTEETYNYMFSAKERVLTRYIIMSKNNDGEYEQSGMVVYEYDSDGKVTERNLYDAEGTFILNELEHTENSTTESDDLEGECTYDDHGRLIERIIRDPKGNIQHREAYEFDKNGNLAKKTYIRSNSQSETKQEREFEYDKNGNLIKVISTQTSTVGNNSNKVKDTYTFSDFVYFYYPDGIPEVEVWPPNYYKHIEVMNYNKKG